MAIWYSNVIDSFFSQALNPILHNFVYNAYTILANHLKYPLGLAVILYITLMGTSIMMGWTKLSINVFVKSAIKIALIYTFALNWGIFSQWIVTGIQGSAEQLGNWLLSATPIHIPQLGGSGIEGALQSVLTEVVRLSQWIFDQGSWHELGPCISAYFLLIFGSAVVVVGFFEIVLAKIMLAILFATAPLFISFTLFEKTHSFFDRWLGQIIGFSFLMIFVMVVLALSMSFMQWAIGDSYNQHGGTVTMLGFIPVMLVGILGVGLVIKVSHMAQSLGGAVSTVSGQQFIAGAVGGFVGGALAINRMGEKKSDDNKSDNNKNSKDKKSSEKKEALSNWRTILWRRNVQ